VAGPGRRQADSMPGGIVTAVRYAQGTATRRHVCSVSVAFVARPRPPWRAACTPASSRWNSPLGCAQQTRPARRQPV